MFVLEGDGLDVYLLRDFLSSEECAALIKYVEADNAPSTVMGDPGDDQFRTSHSSPLAGRDDPLIASVDARIAELTGIDRKFQENIEGQRYHVGQQFKLHSDCFFSNQDYWPLQKFIGGQRTWTVMICLNQPVAGGGTLFPHAGMRIKPRAGNLIAWCNVHSNGEPNPAAMHCGEPVTKGVKYILTKWHRERPFRLLPTDRPRLTIRLMKRRSGLREDGADRAA